MFFSFRIPRRLWVIAALTSDGLAIVVLPLKGASP
jgi:hypothetical protein